MKPPTSHFVRKSFDRSGGFTLIELLVVIGIIALLAAIVLPLLFRSIRSANSVKTAADMQAISLALEEYKKDYGQYPQVGDPNTGFAVLGRDLLGLYGDGFLPGSTSPTPDDTNDPPVYVGGKTYKPGECVSNGNGFVALIESTGVAPAIGPNWAAFSGRDGLDGPGISRAGKKHRGYLQPEKFRVAGCGILDNNGKPILYFPGRAGDININIGTSYVAMGGISKYDAAQNLEFFKRIDDNVDANAMRRMRAYLGDMDNNGHIDTATEQAKTTKAYILWAAGPDGFFGPNAKPSNAAPTQTDVSKCDDVTSFQ